MRLCGGQTPRHAVQVLSINTNGGHFGVDYMDSAKDSGRIAALFPGRSIHPWEMDGLVQYVPASHQQTVSTSFIPVFNIHFCKAKMIHP